MPRRHDVSFLLIAFVGIAASGCGGSKLVPETASAKKSLEAALTAWKDGKAVGPQEGTKPTIQAEDSDWRSKKKLTAFEIIGEEPGQPADAPRKFKTTLTLEGAAPVDAVFVVFGNDPIYVYRDSDYEKHFSKM